MATSHVVFIAHLPTHYWSGMREGKTFRQIHRQSYLDQLKEKVGSRRVMAGSKLRLWTEIGNDHYGD